MKKFLSFAIIALAVLTACNIRREKPQELQTGDLLFQVGSNSKMNEAIASSTSGNADIDTTFTHVGILLIGGDSTSVLEAADGGVKITPIADFINKSLMIDGKPMLVAKRVADASIVPEAIKRAKSFIGQPYDYYYLPDNGKMYCSELVYDSYLDADGNPVFSSKPMKFRAADGSMPQFWTDLFKQLDMDVPEGVQGTNPMDMSRDSVLITVMRWQ